MPTNPTEGKNTEHYDEHGLEKPQPHPSPKFDAEHPGYETTDVNARGIVIFLAGLVGFLAVFFVLCYAMGKALNFGLLHQDAAEERLNPLPYGKNPNVTEQKGRNLADNPYMMQQEDQRIAASFPAPRLEADDSNQSTADLHAREDLLLEHNSLGTDGTVRIPIERAMELVAQRGLPAPAGAAAEPQALMEGEQRSEIHVPLTNGFARTAYEIEQIESREQKMKFAGEAQGETAPANGR